MPHPNITTLELAIVASSESGNKVRSQSCSHSTDAMRAADTRHWP